MTFYQDIKTVFAAVFQIAFGLVALITATPIYMLILGSAFIASFWFGGFVAGIVCFVIILIWFLSTIHLKVTRLSFIPGMVIWSLLALLAFAYLGGYKFGYEIAYPKARELYYGKEVVTAQDQQTKAKQEKEVRNINKNIAGTRIEYVLAEDTFYLNCNNGGGCSGTYQVGNLPSDERMIQVRALNKKVALANKLILERVVTPVYQNGKPEYVGGTEAYIDPLKFLSDSDKVAEEMRKKAAAMKKAAEERGKAPPVIAKRADIRSFILDPLNTKKFKYINSVMLVDFCAEKPFVVDRIEVDGKIYPRYSLNEGNPSQNARLKIGHNYLRVFEVNTQDPREVKVFYYHEG